MMSIGTMIDLVTHLNNVSNVAGLHAHAHTHTIHIYIQTERDTKKEGEEKRETQSRFDGAEKEARDTRMRIKSCKQQ